MTAWANESVSRLITHGCGSAALSLRKASGFPAWSNKLQAEAVPRRWCYGRRKALSHGYSFKSLRDVNACELQQVPKLMS